MNNNSETNLQEIINLLGLQSDTKVRSLLESLLEEVRSANLLRSGLDQHLDIASMLSAHGEQILPQVIDLENLRKIRKRIEERIEALIEKILCLVEQLRKHPKETLNRKRLLRLVLALVNLINLKKIINRLESQFGG